MINTLSTSYIITLSDVFSNLSAGFIGLILITPVQPLNLFVLSKNLLLGLSFYFISVKLKEAVQ